MTANYDVWGFMGVWSKTTRRIMRRIILIFLLSSFCGGDSASFALVSQVALSGGETKLFLQTVEARLTSIMNCLETREWSSVEDHFTPDGLSSLRELIERADCRNVNPLYEAKLIHLPRGGFEAREFKVRIDLQETKGNPYQYLVFELNDAGLVTDARFSLEKWHVEAVLKKGGKLEDEQYRRRILELLEIFRTAYNRKNIDFLRKIYSDDALIIVGKVLEEKEDAPDLLDKSSLSRDRVVFIKKSKKEYIRSLERVFGKNEFIKVNFKELKIRRHPKIEQMYGVTLHQDWNTTKYSDEGYLFLMIDYRNEEKPLIHVRSWQPDKFPDGSVVDMGYFEMID